jgi:hypothetical protein
MEKPLINILLLVFNAEDYIAQWAGTSLPLTLHTSRPIGEQK